MVLIPGSCAREACIDLMRRMTVTKQRSNISSKPTIDVQGIYARWNASQSSSRTQMPPDTDTQANVSEDKAPVIGVSHIYRNWNAQLSA